MDEIEYMSHYEVEPPPGVEVRVERPEDQEAIADVTEAAFGKPREARMVDAIRASDGYVPELSVVAERNGELVGHAMLSYVALRETGRRLLELGPVSVRPDQQQSGVGSAMTRTLLKEADKRGEPLVLVLGRPALSALWIPAGADDGLAAGGKADPRRGVHGTSLECL